MLPALSTSMKWMQWVAPEGEQTAHACKIVVITSYCTFTCTCISYMQIVSHQHSIQVACSSCHLFPIPGDLRWRATRNRRTHSTSCQWRWMVSCAYDKSLVYRTLVDLAACSHQLCLQLHVHITLIQEIVHTCTCTCICVYTCACTCTVYFNYVGCSMCLHCSYTCVYMQYVSSIILDSKYMQVSTPLRAWLCQH